MWGGESKVSIDDLICMILKYFHVTKYSMEPVSEEKDRELKEGLEKRYSVRNPRKMEDKEDKITEWGSTRVEHEIKLIFYRENISDDCRELSSEVSEFIADLEVEKTYSVAYEDEQYPGSDENFEEKFGNVSAEIQPSEIPDVSEELVEFMIVPGTLEWIIVFDHEGDISINGSEEFIGQVKSFFDEWEELSEPPEQRDLGRRD